MREGSHEEKRGCEKGERDKEWVGHILTRAQDKATRVGGAQALNQGWAGRTESRGGSTESRGGSTKSRVGVATH